MKYTAFLTSKLMSPVLEPSQKFGLHRVDSLTSPLSAENFQFEPQLTSLYMVSTPYNIYINPN